MTRSLVGPGRLDSQDTGAWNAEAGRSTRRGLGEFGAVCPQVCKDPALLDRLCDRAATRLPKLSTNATVH